MEHIWNIDTILSWDVQLFNRISGEFEIFTEYQTSHNERKVRDTLRYHSGWSSMKFFQVHFLHDECVDIIEFIVEMNGSIERMQIEAE